MENDNISQNSTNILEKSWTAEEHAQRVREELESLNDLWDKLCVYSDLRSSIINAAAKATSDHRCPEKKSRRRLSVLDRTSVVLSKVTCTISELNEIWDSIDMNEERRLERVSKAYEHVENLLNDMVTTELGMATAIHDQIDEFTGKISEIRRELGLVPFNTGAFTPKSIALWKAMDAELKDLREQREKLIEEQQEIFDRFTRVTMRLGLDLSDDLCSYIPDASVLAPRAKVAELRTRCTQMEGQINERVKRIEDMQKEMSEWIRRMGCECDDNVAAVMEMNARVDECALTIDLMQEAERLRDTLSFEYTEWQTQRESEYEELIVRLYELWRMCCVEEEVKGLPPKFDPESTSIDEVRSEVARLEAMYESRKDVYDKVAVWKTHWEEKINYERSENSKDKYNNRGGALDQRIKYENRLNKQLLPHAMQSVAEAYGAFLNQHVDEVITIEGLEPLAYIEHVVREHELEKVMEKERRQKARKEQLEQETKWGSTPGGRAGAPGLLGRRPLASSATRVTPAAKMPRMATVGEAAHLSFDESAISAISPVKPTEQRFPKTSSPKGSRVTVVPGTRFVSPAKMLHPSGAATPKRPLVPSNKK